VRCAEGFTHSGEELVAFLRLQLYVLAAIRAKHEKVPFSFFFSHHAIALLRLR
jgi:hypothetical protein